MKRLAPVRGTFFAIALVACGGSDTSPTFGDPASTGGDAGAGGSAPSPGGGSTPDPQPGGDGGVSTPSPVPPGGSPDGGAPSSGGGGAIPKPTGTCPDFVNGQVTFNPAGIAPRAVTLTMSDAAKTKHGPLIFYWYGTGSSPAEVQYSLGAQVAAIEAAGGIIAAPVADSAAGQFPWFLVSGTRDDDLRVADEVLACANQKIGIDASHVHSLGMSAGGLQTSAMSFYRSSYLASVVTYSGGISPAGAPPYQDAANKFPAMIFYGGASDNVFNFDFQAASQAYKTKLVGDGHFAFLCNHNRGHMVPTDAAASVWAFFQAHPWRTGTGPDPYAGGLPSGFPTYCSLN